MAKPGLIIPTKNKRKHEYYPYFKVLFDLKYIILTLDDIANVVILCRIVLVLLIAHTLIQ